MAWKTTSKIPTFKIKDLVEMAKKRVSNRKDVIILWDGFRGQGKSTGSWKFCRGLKNFTVNHLGINHKVHKFKPERDMVYTRQDAIRFIQGRKYGILDIDEMINVGYNREFSQADQQAIIKSLNQWRSNFNIISMCNPFFYDLDPDLRSLIWMRVDVIKKGIGLIHTANESIYGNDIWDTNYNRKIEQSWIKNGIVHPRYNQLSTFRGILLYPAMKPQTEMLYESIRDRKRALANPVVNSVNENGYDFNLYDKLVSLALNKQLDKKMIESTCLLHNIKYTTLMTNLNKRLKDKFMGSGTTISKLLIEEPKPVKEEEKPRGVVLPPRKFI